MTQKMNILLAEDNPADVMLVEEALKGTELCYELESLYDGEKVMRM